MYKTNKANVLKIMICMKPRLVHVVRPWGVNDEWMRELRDIGYSVINLDLENAAFPERIREKIERRLATGCVATYGVPISYDALERLLPDEFVLLWMYPSKQTVYHKMIVDKVKDPYRIETSNMPASIGELWKSYLARSDTNDLLRITKVCSEFQRAKYEACLAEHANMIVILMD